MPKERTTKAKTQPRNEIVSRVLRNGTIIDTLFDDEQQPKCRFIVKEPGKEPFECEKYSIGGADVFPPMQRVHDFQTGTIKVASVLADYGTPAELFEDLKRFIGRFLDFSPFHIALMAHYVAMTYIYDDFDAFPYLRFKGEPGTAKSRSLKILNSLCYKATDMGAGPSKSALFRRTEQFRGTVFIDEADIADGDLHSDFIKLLNNGYTLDGVSSCSAGGDGDWEPRTFRVGTPKVLATRLQFGDRALESRVLTIPTVIKKLAAHIPISLPRSFADDAQALRNRLLKYRFDTFHSIVKQEAALRELDGRTIQLGLPIYSISPDEDFKATFLRYLKSRTHEMHEDSPLHIILEVIKQICGKERERKIPLHQIRQEALMLGRERDINPSEFSERRVGELVRSLSFKVVRWGQGSVAYVDSYTITRQAQRLGIQADTDTGVLGVSNTERNS